MISHLLVTLAKLGARAGLGALVAESLAVKHQLVIMKRAQRRAPNLTSWDRLALGGCALLVPPKGQSKMAVILKPSTLLCFHHALVKRFHRWLANLRVLEVDEIKAIPCTPRSHAFVERLIGTVRREYLDRTLFWNQSDLERKLENHKAYYNQHRSHSGLAGATPAQRSGVPRPPMAKLESYSWRQHCNGLSQTPTAA